MEAKDTVMKIPQLQHLWGNENWQYVTSTMTDFFGVVAKAQAEISFKAGVKVGYQRGLVMKPDPDGVYENGLIDGKQEGRKEVVEWIETHKTINFFDPFSNTPRLERWLASVNHKDWQAKLREWGIE